MSQATDASQEIDQLISETWVKEYTWLKKMIDRWTLLPSAHGVKYKEGQLKYWNGKMDALMAQKPESVDVPV